VGHDEDVETNAKDLPKLVAKLDQT